jgi:hypothetical protein
MIRALRRVVGVGNAAIHPIKYAVFEDGLMVGPVVSKVDRGWQIEGGATHSSLADAAKALDAAIAEEEG